MILAIVQARMGSTRLPGKVLKEVCGKSLIEILLNRLSRSKKIDKTILATSENAHNDYLAEIVANLGFEVFRGSEDDVLDRYYLAVREHQPEPEPTFSSSEARTARVLARALPYTRSQPCLRILEASKPV